VFFERLRHTRPRRVNWLRLCFEYFSLMLCAYALSLCPKTTRLLRFLGFWLLQVQQVVVGVLTVMMNT
jgi:hypothetical protein